MARKTDSGWRDLLLDVRHDYYGFDFPVAGMTLPMVEYDKGHAVGLVSYHRWGHGLPKGLDAADAHRAFSRLIASRDGSQLPFLTAVYDPEHWTMKVFAHNDAARLLVGTGWHVLTEREFAAVLYRMRDRDLPDLSRYGVEWNTKGETWSDRDQSERWPGQAMSYRRRAYEPRVSVPFKLRVPCMDIDFAVVDVDRDVALVVDYKRAGTTGQNPGDDWNLKALASLVTPRGVGVAAFVAEYAPVKPSWDYRVKPLNTAARSLLSYTLGSNGFNVKKMAEAVAGTGWISLTEDEWTDVLRCARDL